jgi:peptidyl-prolyl cis-trans isomerase C
MKKSTAAFFSVTIVLLTVNAGMTFKLMKNPGGEKNAAVDSLSCGQLQELANKLAAKGLTTVAAGAYERYLDACKPQAREAAYTRMRIGELYLKAHRYEDALAHLYTAEALDDSIKEHTGVKIVEALEKLQRPQEARYELKQRTAVEESAGANDDLSPVVARIGEDYIRESDLDALMASLPPELAPMMKQPGVRDTLINQFVIQEMLYRKALREGTDKAPEVRQALDMMTKQIVVQHMLQSQVLDNAAVTEQDLKLYYEAHKNEFEEPASLAIDMVQLKDKENVESARKRLETAPEKTGIWLEQSFTYIPEVGDAPEVVPMLFGMAQGVVSDVQTIEGKRYMFKVSEKKELSYVPFEDLKETLRNRYQSEKQQELTDAFIKNVYEAEDVEIYGFPGDNDSSSAPPQDKTQEGTEADADTRA